MVEPRKNCGIIENTVKKGDLRLWAFGQAFFFWVQGFSLHSFRASQIPGCLATLSLTPLKINMELKHESLEDDFPLQRAVFLGSMLRFGETFYLVIATKKLSLLANLEKRIFTPPNKQNTTNRFYIYINNINIKKISLTPMSSPLSSFSS